MPHSAAPYDVIILGAGAAGLMCAITAGQRGRRVLLLDHAAEPGAKILISGGGRCNFTNTGTAPECFLSDNPHFARSALDRYPPEHFIALVRRHGIAFHEKAKGQLFCDGSARAIVAMLLDEAQAAGVDLRLAHRITGLSKADFFVSTPITARSPPPAWSGHRRIIDPQTRRHRLRLRRRAPVRPSHDGNPPRPGAADLR